MTPPGAVVVGADYRALGAVRSLGRRGVAVCVVREPSERLAATSRYVQANYTWPTDDAGERVAYLHTLARRHGLRDWALIPSADETAALIARNHVELARDFQHTTPPWLVLRWAYDKRLTYELARRLDVPQPWTAFPGADVAGLAGRDWSFPAVIKPTVKESHNRLTAAKAWRVDSRQQLVARYREAVRLVSPETLMVQELVPGNGHSQLSYAALCRDGEVLAAITARRTRQYPADFGRASTYVETIRCPELAEPSHRILQDLRFTGLIELEFKRDARDDTVKLLDMNPRLWGWHTLGARAGVDFPYLLWLAVSGHALPATNGRPGAAWLRFSTDTPTAIRELARGRLSARDYARSWLSPHERAIFTWDDPLPGLMELPLMTRTLLQRIARGKAV
jgi:predicted ATP-grasp superfamily ATP-dependent carboligase